MSPLAEEAVVHLPKSIPHFRWEEACPRYWRQWWSVIKHSTISRRKHFPIWSHGTHATFHARRLQTIKRLHWVHSSLTSIRIPAAFLRPLPPALPWVSPFPLAPLAASGCERLRLGQIHLQLLPQKLYEQLLYWVHVWSPYVNTVKSSLGSIPSFIAVSNCAVASATWLKHLHRNTHITRPWAALSASKTSFRSSYRSFVKA